MSEGVLPGEYPGKPASEQKSYRIPFPKSVQDAIEDPNAPTPPIEDFAIAMTIDPNVFWMLSCGHHMNLLEASIEEATKHMARAATAIHDANETILHLQKELAKARGYSIAKKDEK